MVDEIEKYEEIASNSDVEFSEQQELAKGRIDHIILLQDQLRNHIANLEAIQNLLEQKANTAKDAERIKIFKSISYNYERLIKLYEVYQSYEMVIQRYHVHQTDTINKKFGMNISALKNNKQDKTSMDFFRKLHGVLTSKSQEEIDQLTELETTEFDS
jgi:hypothetical protein